MSLIPFEEVFGFNKTPQNELSQTKICVPWPSLPESSNLYQKLKDICADPQFLLELLNIQIINHVRSGTPDHFTCFELSQTLNPFFSILPYILSDRIIIEQAHHVRINVKNFLSSWQYFSFQCFYSYFHQILSSKIYTGDSRQWLLTTIFDLLSQHKSVYSNSIVTRVHLKDKQYKDKTNLHAVIHCDQTINVYLQNVCIKKGILKYEPDTEFPTHQIIEMNSKNEVTNKSRVVILEPGGEKTTSDSANHFFNEGYQINHLVWSCMSCKSNDFSFEAIDAISRMIFGFKGVFLQIFYYSKPIECVFKSLFKASVFIHRHSFVLKTLIWAIYDESLDKNNFFKSSFPAVHYLIRFVKYITRQQTKSITDKIVDFIDVYQSNIDNCSSVSNPLDDEEFKRNIIQKFWTEILNMAKTLPKSMFDICFNLVVASDLHSSGVNRDRYAQVKNLLFGELIIPHMIDFLRTLKDKIYKDCVNFVIKTVTMTAASNNQNEFSCIGFEPFQKFIEFTSQDSTNMNIKDIKMPTVADYVSSVLCLIDCIKGSSDYIRNSLPIKDLDFTSPSSFVDMPDVDDKTQGQLPALRRTRTLRVASGTLVTMKDSDACENRFQPLKEIPKKIFPWKTRIARDIFFSYYSQMEQNK